MHAHEIIPQYTLRPLQGAPLFHIQTLEGMEESECLFDEPPHSHDHFELIWITNGSGICHMDLSSHKYCANAVFCIKPGSVHQLRADNPPTGFIISFYQAFLNGDEHEFDAAGEANLYHVFSAGHGIAVPDEMAARMNALAIAMATEFEQCSPFSFQILKRLLKVFFIYLIHRVEVGYGATKQTREVALAEQFSQLLEKNYRDLKMVSDYAKLLFITPNYLSEVVRKTTGISAGQHIRQRIALEAKRMGRYTGSCMKEIADNLGFTDSAHFSKFFKSVSGRNFTDFKKENAAILQMV